MAVRKIPFLRAAQTALQGEVERIDESIGETSQMVRDGVDPDRAEGEPHKEFAASATSNEQGHARRECQQAVDQITDLINRGAKKHTRIQTGSIVEVAENGEVGCFFLLGHAGGATIKYGRREVTVITPQSPLWIGIIGKIKGDPAFVGTNGKRREVCVVSVQ